MELFTVDKLEKYLSNKIPDAVGFLGKIILAFIAYYIAARIIRCSVRIFKNFLDRREIEPSAVRFMASILNAGLYFILLASIATGFGVTEASVLAILGSIGVGVGLALQGGLSNIAGGMIIVVLKPFVIGDYIIQQNLSIEGTVQQIDFFYTTLLTVDNRKVVVPNAQLTNNSIINVTSQDKRKLEIKVSISYEANLSIAKGILEELLHMEKSIMSDQEMVVFVDQLADHGVIIGFRAWVKTEEYWSTKWRLNEKIKEAFDNAGIGIPYHQLDVHLIK